MPAQKAQVERRHYWKRYWLEEGKAKNAFLEAKYKKAGPEKVLALQRAWASKARAMKQIMSVDRLTGLYNRETFYKLVPRMMNRKACPKSFIAMIDLDRFKQVNDILGHNIGDLVLQTFGKTFMSLTRNAKSKGLAARRGGEELLVWMPLNAQDGLQFFGRAKREIRKNLESNKAFQAALQEKKEKILQTKELAQINHLIGRTFSAGMVEVEPKASFAKAMKHAHDLMHDAKEGGRNRIFWGKVY